MPRNTYGQTSQPYAPFGQELGELGQEYGQEAGESYEAGEFGSGEVGFNFEYGGGQQEYGQGEGGQGEAGEVQTMELASQFLEVNSEEEMDHFLGDLVSRAAGGIRDFANSSTGQALGGILKAAAKKALPIAGAAVGGYFGGPTGAKLGGQLAGAAGSAFGLEVEGLSNEDRDFEVARQFVRFADAATKNATAALGEVGGGGAVPPPQAAQVAKAAAIEAAKQFAPGLLRPAAGPGPAGGPSAAGAAGGPPQHHRHRPMSGRWIRRGKTIVLLGVSHH